MHTTCWPYRIRSVVERLDTHTLQPPPAFLPGIPPPRLPPVACRAQISAYFNGTVSAMMVDLARVIPHAILATTAMIAVPVPCPRRHRHPISHLSHRHRRSPTMQEHSNVGGGEDARGRCHCSRDIDTPNTVHRAHYRFDAGCWMV